MKITEVCGVYFSPAGTTRTVVAAAAEAAAEALGVPVRLVSLNLPVAREKALDFPAETLVFVGAPTYAGRLPNKISPDLHRILRGNGTPAAAIVTYGNRAYENALAELSALLAENGFQPAAIPRRVRLRSDARTRTTSMKCVLSRERLRCASGTSDISFRPPFRARPTARTTSPRGRAASRRSSSR